MTEVYQPGSTITGQFPIFNSGTGAAVNADSTPVLSFYRNGTLDGAVSVSISNPSTGRYTWSVTVPVGYLLGDAIRIEATATVGGVVIPANTIFRCRLDAQVDSRSTYAGADTTGTTTLLGRLTFGRAGNLDNLDAAVSGVDEAVWASPARTLSSFGTLVADVATAVWGAGIRTLTALASGIITGKPAVTLAAADVTGNLPAQIKGIDANAITAAALATDAAQEIGVATVGTLVNTETLADTLTTVAEIVGQMQFSGSLVRAQVGGMDANTLTPTAMASATEESIAEAVWEKDLGTDTTGTMLSEMRFSLPGSAPDTVGGLATKGYLDSVWTAARLNALTWLEGMIELSGLTRRFKASALATAPTGSGGGPAPTTTTPVLVIQIGTPPAGSPTCGCSRPASCTCGKCGVDEFVIEYESDVATLIFVVDQESGELAGLPTGVVANLHKDDELVGAATFSVDDPARLYGSLVIPVGLWADIDTWGGVFTLKLMDGTDVFAETKLVAKGVE
jgi:hypothetical protein